MNKGIKITVGFIIGFCLLLASASYASAQGALDAPTSQMNIDTGKLNIRKTSRPLVVAANSQSAKPVYTKTTTTRTVITKSSTTPVQPKKKIVKKKTAAKKKPVTVAAVNPKSSAATNPVQSQKSLRAAELSGNSTTTVKKEKVAAESKTKIKSQVDFTYGKNNDIDEDKQGFKDNFYEIAPQIKFEGEIFSGSFKAAIMDWQNQETSNIAKKSTADVDFTMTLPVTNSIKSKTKTFFGYNDEKTPDYNDFNGDGQMDGYTVRYVQYGIKQSFDGKFDNNLLLEVGGSFKRRDHSNLDSDRANELLEEYLFEEDHNEGAAFGTIGYMFNKDITWTLSPSVKQKKYDNRRGRQTDGTKGGQAIPAPKYELITSDLTTRLNLKIAGLELSPMARIGQVSDEALGAESQDYYGGGISTAITIVKSINMKLEASYEFVTRKYDNWTKDVDVEGDTRINDDTETRIALSTDLTKNSGISFHYRQNTEDSNLEDSPDHNFRQEIVGTTLTIKF